MRIAIDLQGAQGTSKNRGIGRYVLNVAQAIVRNSGDHDIIVVLSDLFPNTVTEIRDQFKNILPQENIHVWKSFGPVAWSSEHSETRRENAELVREAFIAALKPDVILVLSFLEGFSDDVVTSIGKITNIPTAAVLYDLIPLVYKNLYLNNDELARWYHHKVQNLKESDVLLAISDATRLEGKALLQLKDEKIVSISSAAGDFFRPIPVSQTDIEGIERRYGLRNRFIMYTGGIDPRKNIDRLIAVFSNLPQEVRDNCQLAIVCNVEDAERIRLESLVKEHGMDSTNVVLTGYISDDELLALYNLCLAFVFPSLHEGFGLPILEAMACGKAVITSNTSSMPEVVGRADALFDPFDEVSMLSLMSRVISETSFRKDLEVHSLKQAKNFSWDITAKRTITELIKICADTKELSPSSSLSSRKKILAMFSPLPPMKSGIADYSANLICYLQAYYDIEIIIDQPWQTEELWNGTNPVRHISYFLENYSKYDRILYHFGNSEFHAHMFPLLDLFPGIVVLHDFFLSGIQAHMGMQNFAQALEFSHGLAPFVQKAENQILSYPANLKVLQNASGVIVHSKEAMRLADYWYGSAGSNKMREIPLMRVNQYMTDDSKSFARSRLGVNSSEVLLCSFGHLSQSKLSAMIVESFALCSTPGKGNIKLVFVGEVEDIYGELLRDLIASLGVQGTTKITGWVDEQTYHDYLLAADIAIQLRSSSRGETSAAILDCMSFALPTIVNAHGSMAELETDAVIMLPDDVSDVMLADAIDKLVEDRSARVIIGSRAREVISRDHSPEYCSMLYHDAIEHFYAAGNTVTDRVIAELNIDSDNSISSVGQMLARNFSPLPRQPALFVEVDMLFNDRVADERRSVAREILRDLLTRKDLQYRVVPVRRYEGGCYVTVHKFLEGFSEGNAAYLREQSVDFFSGDIFLGLDLDLYRPQEVTNQLAEMHRFGVIFYHLIFDGTFFKSADFSFAQSELYASWIREAGALGSIVCVSEAVAKDLYSWSKRNSVPIARLAECSWLYPDAASVRPIPIAETLLDIMLIAKSKEQRQ